MEELSLEQKAEQVNKEIQLEKEGRVNVFIEELNELCKKHNCSLIAQAIIEGDKCRTQIQPVAL